MGRSTMMAWTLSFLLGLAMIEVSSGYVCDDCHIPSQPKPANCRTGAEETRSCQCDQGWHKCHDDDCPSGMSHFVAGSGFMLCNIDGCRKTRSVTNGKCTTCNSGYLLSGGYCEACPKGKYGTNGRSCYNCAAGKYQGSTARSSCSNCAVGKYSLQGYNGASTCTSCPKGKYQGSTGKSFCINCQAGKHVPLVGQTVCDNCAAGKYSGSGLSACIACQAGMYSPEAASTCTNCQAGTFARYSGSMQCNQCEPGRYNTLQGQTKCIDCMPGRFSGQGSSSVCTRAPCDKLVWTRPVAADFSDGAYNFFYGAWLCIDGNLDTMCASRANLLTDNNASHRWLRLDLGSFQMVTGIFVKNRRDCCQSRLYNKKIRVGHHASSAEGSYQFATGIKWEYDVSVGRFDKALWGRYVFIAGYDIINLAEVMVQVQRYPKCDPLQVVAWRDSVNGQNCPVLNRLYAPHPDEYEAACRLNRAVADGCSILCAPEWYDEPPLPFVGTSV